MWQAEAAMMKQENELTDKRRKFSKSIAKKEKEMASLQAQLAERAEHPDGEGSEYTEEGTGEIPAAKLEVPGGGTGSRGVL